MSCYIISYDLKHPGSNYDALTKEIKAYGTWARINESVWAVVTEMTAVQVRDDLSRHIDSNDRIFVAKSGVEAAWRNSICKNEWLKKHL
jgi:CRISPR/Cas system-associated endoribonuclease Cas2